MRTNWYSMVSRLQARLNNPYPLEYVLEEARFCGESFFVEPCVLIPRAETETLVNYILQKYAVCDFRHKSFSGHAQSTILRILDLGTGSGNIAVMLAKELNCKVYAVDISDSALKIAGRNALMHRVEDRIEFHKSDWYNEINIKPVDIIVSNPPYIAEEEWNLLPAEVKDYEPKIALWGGNKGLDHYKKIISDAKKILVSDGIIVLEIGCDQTESVKDLLKKDFKDIEIIADQFGKDRVISGIWIN